jgi:hypothetical protein
MVGTKMGSRCAEKIPVGPLIFEAAQLPLLARTHSHEMEKRGVPLILSSRLNLIHVVGKEGANDVVDP